MPSALGQGAIRAFRNDRERPHFRPERGPTVTQVERLNDTWEAVGGFLRCLGSAPALS